MIAKQRESIKDAPMELFSEDHKVFAGDNHKCKHNLVMSTGEFFKNYDEELDNTHYAARSLKMAVRKNDHVLGIANDGTKKAYKKYHSLTFNGASMPSASLE